MNVSPQIMQELKILGISFVSGMVLVMIYDVLRICRRVLVHKTAVVVIEDIIYWIFSAFAVVCVYYEINEGMIRGFAMGGMAAGMLMENHFVSPFVIRFFCFLFKKLETVLRRPVRILKKLLKKLCKLVKISLCKL